MYDHRQVMFRDALVALADPPPDGWTIENVWDSTGKAVFLVRDRTTDVFVDGIDELSRVIKEHVNPTATGESR